MVAYSFLANVKVLDGDAASALLCEPDAHRGAVERAVSALSEVPLGDRFRGSIEDDELVELGPGSYELTSHTAVAGNPGEIVVVVESNPAPCVASVEVSPSNLSQYVPTV